MARHFTLDEANRLLPRLEPLLRGLVEQRRALRERQQILSEFQARARGNGGVSRGPEVLAARQAAKRLTAQIRQGIEEVQALGCVVKDLDMGLVDFPAIRNGVEVYLCYRLGEDRIAFWHGTDEGYAGRKPLADEPH
ncbi:MAG TPA: DUF2203 domain-containing protein [Candidatus Methylomirabilis sp.]|jgi:hypothetical protein